MGKTSKQNMVGKKYGFLTVLSEIELRNKNGHIMYNVKCDCGKEKSVLGASLRNGLSRSCNKCTLLTGSHGMWNTKVFRVWISMKSRCSNANSPSYKNYGARGIKVCDRWLNSFENFINQQKGLEGIFWFVYNTELTEMAKNRVEEWNKLSGPNRKVFFFFFLNENEFKQKSKILLSVK